MPRSRLAVLVLAAACSMTPRVRDHSFDPGENVASGQSTQLELHSIKYEERHLTLQITVTNNGQEPLTLERDGVLLAYQKLEFPVAENPQLPVPEEMEVPAGEAMELWIPFSPGTQLLEDATLRLRSLERSGRHLEALALPVPAHPGKPRA